MRVTFRDHHGKGQMIARALKSVGHRLVSYGGDVALLDADVPISPYAELCDAHPLVLVYPHGGGNPFAGGRYRPHSNTVRRFVPGVGQADVFSACDYPVPVDVIGFPFCDRVPFAPTDNPRRVLLAPAHPMADGFLSAGLREINARLHDMLAVLPVQLTVRFVPIGGMGLDHIGITPRRGVIYEDGAAGVGDGVAAADSADVVVASDGTFPSLAIARGRPTLMYGQVPPHEHVNGTQQTWESKTWPRYRNVVRYPLDVDHVTDPAELWETMVAACSDDGEIAEWRDRFIGDQFSPTRFVELFEAAVKENLSATPRGSDYTRTGVAP